MSKFDIGVDFTNPAKVYLEHPDLGVVVDENGIKGWVEILSTKHPSIIRLQRQRREKANKIVKGMFRGKNADFSLDQQEAEDAALLSAAIVGWHLVNLGGRHIDAPPTEENKLAILTDTNWEFLRAVVDRGMANDEVFMPNSRLYSLITQSASSSLESSTNPENPSGNT